MKLESYHLASTVMIIDTGKRIAHGGLKQQEEVKRGGTRYLLSAPRLQAGCFLFAKGRTARSRCPGQGISAQHSHGPGGEQGPSGGAPGGQHRCGPATQPDPVTRNSRPKCRDILQNSLWDSSEVSVMKKTGCSIEGALR